jgi:hypothetical protein
MTDEPPQEEEEQLTEKEKLRWVELEDEERRRLQANNEHIEGQAAGVYEHNNKAGTHAQSDTYRQEGQQIDASSVTAAETRQESNTNPQTGTPEQEAAGNSSSSTGDVTDNADNTNLMQLELTNEVKQQEIVSENVTSVLNILKAKAEFNGTSKELHLRVAPDTKVDETGTTRTIQTTTFYDLTNPQWEAVKITPEGWSIIKRRLSLDDIMHNLRCIPPKTTHQIY